MMPENAPYDNDRMRREMLTPAPGIPMPNDGVPTRPCAHYIERARTAEAEVERLRALLKQAHDRDKFLGEFPTIKWYDDVARYFKGQVP